MYFWDKHKTITSYYELLSGEVCDRYELTQMEYDILMFLHNNPQHNTAADIVKVRKSTKSHVSTSLKNLENKGLVERIQSQDNKKHIEIVLLDKAEIIVKAGISNKDVKLDHFMDLNYFKYENNLQVYYGILKHEVNLVEEKNKLEWVAINDELLDNSKFAGNYNIPHIIRQIKVYLKNGTEIDKY